jgi:hypothetical protein
MSGRCDFCGVWHSGSCSHPGRQWKERAERAEAERDALRADAARLDWLEQHWYDGVYAKNERGWLTWQCENYAPTLRDAIDAALGRGEG